MARGHRLNTSIVLAAVHGLSGLFRAVSAVEPSLCRPLPTLSPSLISHLASVDVKHQERKSASLTGVFCTLPTSCWCSGFRQLWPRCCHSARRGYYVYFIPYSLKRPSTDSQCRLILQRRHCTHTVVTDERELRLFSHVFMCQAQALEKWSQPPACCYSPPHCTSCLPEGRPGMSAWCLLSGISGLSFVSPFLSPLLFFSA